MRTSNNVVHRDIKPANIMYEPETDTVKVTDFGIARITDSSQDQDRHGARHAVLHVAGAACRARRSTGGRDLFSLAVTLYQLACGKLPFDGDSMAQLMFKIANEPAPDILDFNPTLPHGIVAFLDEALAKDAEQRYQTGDGVRRGAARRGGAACASRRERGHQSLKGQP